MPIEIRMPALSPTMKEGTLSRWLKKEGDAVKPGDIIAEIETDKATMEVESVEEGIVGKILIEAGSLNVAVNEVIALLLEEGEEKHLLDDYCVATEKTPSAAVESNMPKETRAEPVPVASCISPSPSGRIIASPLAKRVAAKENIDLHHLKGSGPHGRIIHADVIEAAKNPSCVAQPAPNVGRNSVEFSAKPNSSMRKIIARRLLESKTTVPHFYLSVECDMDALLEMRNVINHETAVKDTKEGRTPSKISVNDCVIKAVALALKDIPAANASWTEEAILQFNNVDVAVAVAIDGGLITPIVKNADQKSLAVISQEMKGLIGKAKANSLKPEEFQGGGFCISNLGMYNIDHFSAIINPPQSCILAVGAIREKALVKNNNIIIGMGMTVTLSCDHRVVDGAVGAEFLARFKRYIESPILMFI